MIYHLPNVLRVIGSDADNDLWVLVEQVDVVRGVPETRFDGKTFHLAKDRDADGNACVRWVEVATTEHDVLLPPC